jgi:hypothetical protein
MPVRPFNTVPDWVSWVNQGANVTVADLNRDGTPDMLVLRVDAPPGGPNAAFYKVGMHLDAQGGVQHWGPWLPIPDWDSSRDEGAGIAVANFGVDGLGLVVLQVRDRGNAAANNGRYRIGRGLDDNGKVQGGWSAWRDVPDWRSFRDQGAAIAVADLDNDGSPELVVFHIDDFHTDHQNPGLPNKGFYRVGRELGVDGEVAAWGDWKAVDWDSFFNEGAGIAVADLDNTGRPNLVVFQIDNPPGENNGKYRVGWNIDVQGNVQDGWGPWVTIDGWDSWEDDGGGLALANFGAGQRPKAVVLHVDNPPEQNSGRYYVLDLLLDIDQAATKGVWRLLPYFSEVLPVHAALLHTGKVLFFAGSGNNIFRQSSPDFGNEARGIYASVIWDVQTNSFDHPPTLRRANNQVVDYFCCGHCFLSDGRLLVGGGSDKYDVVIVNGQMQAAGHGFTGLKDAMIFDPKAETWKLIQSMKHGRWYPTLLMLNDGQAIATAGLDEDGQDNDTIEKIANPDKDSWKPGRAFRLPLYPHLFLLQDGRLLYSGGKMDTSGTSDPLIFDPLLPTQSVLIKGLADDDKCNQCASVVLPPAQKQQFMILGGGPQDVDGQPRQPATKRVSIVDLQAPGANPKYERKADLHHERMHVNAVLLPDHTVLATGGGVTREASQGGAAHPTQFDEVFEAEIYDPGTNTWTLTSAATIARLYHSVALLLPDGRVVTAGGNPDKGRNVTWLPPEDPFEEMRLEIYSPPYLFKFDATNPRPVIINAPTNISYGVPFTIETAQPQQIAYASLIRPGLTTHSFNVEQRLVDVPLQQAPPGGLHARIDGDDHIAPPGWYMLFITDMRGVPSVAHWVHLS